MLVHVVYFWLERTLDEAARAAFRSDLEALLQIDTVRFGHVGTPAETEQRPAIDRSYDFGLVVAFDDLAGHDAYQVHPLHHRFLDRHADQWTRLQIFDQHSHPRGAAP
jgi:hypothetical protein